MGAASSLFGNLLAVVLPLALFVISLHAAFKNGTRRAPDFSGVLWTGACMMVNVLSCFWGATVLSSIKDGQVPPALVQVSLSGGIFLFVTLVFVLYSRGIALWTVLALSQIPKALRFALGRRKREK